MTKVRRVPYYAIERSLFRGEVWKQYAGSVGAVPISTPQTVSYERLAPDELLPSKPPQPVSSPPQTKDKSKTRDAKAARQQAPADARKKQNPPTQKQAEEALPTLLEAEEKDKLPDFDLQDVSVAMDKKGWVVAAKLVRRWFSNPKLIWNNDKKAVLSIDDSSVTLDWVRTFGLVEWKYQSLLSQKIYNDNAIDELKIKIKPILEKSFQNTTRLGFETALHLNNLHCFHLDWNFQHVDIANYETMTKSLSMTDLTAALANFGIYAAVGRVEVMGSRYFRYDNKNKVKTYCIDPRIVVTHLYVYVKDNYSFNDDPHSSKTQYLGHWNKSGMIVTTGGKISDFVDGKQSLLHTDMGNSNHVETIINWDYIVESALDKVVDARRGIVRKFKEKDVYFPVFNKNFNEWREKHDRGGDFWIFSKPHYMKLGKPIEFSLDTLCRRPEKM